jgi:membrane protein DedA with SNARE-associated domain/membrane-associated phospholipid phosphatase
VQALLDRIITLVGAHQLWAYAVVWLLAASEALPVVGAFVPGTAVIVAIAALVPSGAVSLWPILLAATVGAVAGDGFSFWLGHRYRDTLTTRWGPLRRRPELVARGRQFLDRHGGKSILLARFTPGVRAVVPLIAGIAGMPLRLFYVANVLSAVLWAASHILPAVAVGASVELVGAVAGRLALLLAITAVVLWLLVVLVRLVLRRGVPLLERTLDAVWRWASTRDTRLAKAVATLLDPHREAFPLLLLLAGIMIAAGWVFFGVLEDVVSGDPLVRFDAAVYHFFRGLRTPWSDQALITVTELGDTVVTTAVTVAAVAWLAYRRRWRAAAYLVGAVAFASALENVLKATLRVSRPVPLYAGWSAFSFPSGHATANTALYAFLAFLVARELPGVGRTLAVGAAALLAGAIAFSRVYLGAHWLSDVLAGVTLSLAWVAVLAIAHVRREPALRVRPLGLAVVVLAVLVGVGGANATLRHQTDVERYAVHEQTRRLAMAEWWSTGWQQLPPRRTDLTGEDEKPFTLEWAGDPAELERRLLAAGWQKPAPWTLRTILAWLDPAAGPAALPVLPRLDDGRPPALTVIKPLAQAARPSRLVLRLWPTIFVVQTDGGAVPLWVGTAVGQELSRPASVFTVARTLPDVNLPRQALAAALPEARTVERADRPPRDEWDGKLLLGRPSE